MTEGQESGADEALDSPIDMWGWAEDHRRTLPDEVIIRRGLEEVYDDSRHDSETFAEQVGKIIESEIASERPGPLSRIGKWFVRNSERAGKSRGEAIKRMTGRNRS